MNMFSGGSKAGESGMLVHIVGVITLHTRADETNDIHDHDELHAAAAVLELMPENPVLAEDNYISRWIDGLLDT
jgi:hypothetical protein